jgi:hypothetical protein
VREAFLHTSARTQEGVRQVTPADGAFVTFLFILTTVNIYLVVTWAKDKIIAEIRNSKESK